MRIVVGLGIYRSIFKSKRYFKFISILFLFYATRSRIPTAELGNIIATKLVSPRYLQSEQPAIDINKWNEFYGNLSHCAMDLSLLTAMWFLFIIIIIIVIVVFIDCRLQLHLQSPSVSVLHYCYTHLNG